MKNSTAPTAIALVAFGIVMLALSFSHGTPAPASAPLTAAPATAAPGAASTPASEAPTPAASAPAPAPVPAQPAGSQ
jgi:pyruvate dehydrogenase E2 component (dihydrolipoyllysine-residue acetyltransferase)